MEKLELEVGLVDLKFWLLFQKNSEQIGIRNVTGFSE